MMDRLRRLVIVGLLLVTALSVLAGGIATDTWWLVLDAANVTASAYLVWLLPDSAKEEPE